MQIHQLHQNIGDGVYAEKKLCQSIQMQVEFVGVLSSFFFYLICVHILLLWCGFNN